MRPIPQNTMFGSRHTMDISALERRLAEDSQSNSATPLLVLAEAGSIVTGHCDNITRLREICDKYNVWLHLRGHSLAALSFSNNAKDLVKKSHYIKILNLFSLQNYILTISFTFTASQNCGQYYFATECLAWDSIVASSCILQLIFSNDFETSEKKTTFRKKITSNFVFLK